MINLEQAKQKYVGHEAKQLTGLRAYGWCYIEAACERTNICKIDLMNYLPQTIATFRAEVEAMGFKTELSDEKEYAQGTYRVLTVSGWAE